MVQRDIYDSDVKRKFYFSFDSLLKPSLSFIRRRFQRVTGKEFTFDVLSASDCQTMNAIVDVGVELFRDVSSTVQARGERGRAPDYNTSDG